MPSERAPKSDIIRDYLDGSLASDKMSEAEGLIERDPKVCTLLEHDKLETFIGRLQEALAMPPFPAEKDDRNSQAIRRAVAAQIQQPAPADDTAALNGGDPLASTDSQAPAVAQGPGFAFLSPPQAADEIGRLNGYRVLRLLGQGGMGVVFEAEDVRLKRRVALKVMKPEIAAKEEHRVRFLREAQTAAAVEHDHICPIYQVGEENGVPFIAMPFLKGEPLDARLKRQKPLPVAEAIRIGREVAQGLAQAHKAGLVHRDIKPGNIWLESLSDGHSRCRILDFGLARSMSDDVHLTQSGAIMGTPAYMAPEQARARPVDHRADLFSLGVILYEMTTGHRPFNGGDTMSILTSLAIDDPVAPNLINPAVPAELADLTMRLLAKAPEKRPASGQAVAEALLGALMNTSRPIVEVMPGSAAPRRATAEDRTAIDPWQGIDDSVPSAAPQPKQRTENKAAATQPKRETAPKRAQASKPQAPSDRRRSRLGWGILAASLFLLIGGGFAAYKLYFETKDGMLVVEVDSDADVRFKNGQLQIFDADGKLKYTLTPSEKNKTLPPGKYLVKIVGADGVRVESREFVMEKNGKASVRVVADHIAVAKKEDAKWMKADGTPIHTPAAPSTYALRFDAGDTVKLPSNLKFRNLTVEGWFFLDKEKTPANGGAIQVVNLGSRGGNVAIGFGPAKGWYFEKAQSTVRDLGRWTHVAAVRSENNVLLYIDGKKSGSGAWAGNEEADFIRPPHFGSSKFDGLVKELRISSTVRYDEDFKPAQRFEPDADTLALYHFDEGSGDVLKDSSGNGHHGKIIGAQWVRVDGPPPNATPTIDLLPLIDLAKDAVVGDWKFNDKSELVSGAGEYVRIRIPYQPPPEYDLRVSFTRISGAESVSQILVGGGRQFRLDLGSHLNKISAFSMVDGKPADDNPTTKNKDAWLTNGKRHEVRVEVRKNSVAAYLDGALVTGLTTDFKNLALKATWSLKDPTVLGLSSWQSPTVFHKVLVVEISGPGTFTRPDDPAAKKAAEQRKIAIPPVYVPRTPEEKEFQQLQRDWAKKLNREVETNSPSGIVMVLIPPGGEALTKPYLMGKYEVTQAEWEAAMGYNPSGFGPKNAKVATMDTSNFPVENVTWYDGVEFCNKLSEKEGLKPYYELKVTKRAKDDKQIEEAEVKIVGGTGYHIPTDAEWEHACRAGSKTTYHFGDKDEELPQYAWFRQNSENRTHRVGELKPNAFGLYDMHGNVHEWNEEMLTNAMTSAPERVLRGGSYNNSTAASCGVAGRGLVRPAQRYGLRVARRFPPEMIERSPLDDIVPKLALDPALPWRPKELIAVAGAQRFDSWRRYVTKVHLSKDGKTLYASSQDGAITIRDADSGRVRQLFEHRILLAYGSAAFAVSPDERWLVYQKNDKEIVVRDLMENKEVKTLPGTLRADVAFSPDGKWLLAVTMPKLRIFDPAADWKVHKEIDLARQGEYNGGGIAFARVSRDSKLAAVIFDGADAASRVRTFDLGSGNPAGDFQPERRIVVGTFGVRNDDFLFSGWGLTDPQHLIGRFNLKTGKLGLEKPFNMHGMALSPDGKQMLVGRFGGISAVNPDNLSPIWTKSTKFLETMAVSYSGDGQRFAIADSTGRIELYDPKTGSLIGTPPPHHLDYTQFFALPDGRAFLSGANIDSRLFDFVTGKDVTIPKIDGMSSALPTPDGRELMVVLPKQRRLTFVDWQTGKPVRHLTIGTDALKAWPIDAGRKLLLQTKDSLAIADIESGLVAKEIPGPSDTWNRLAVDAAGRRAAVARTGKEGRLELFELPSAKLERSIDLGAIWRAEPVFSRDGQWLACGYSDASYGNGPEPAGAKVRLWAAATGEERTLVVPKKDCRPGFAIDISPNGEELASGGYDGCVHFWDIKTGNFCRSIRIGPANGVIWNVAYAPDGRHLMVNTPSGMVLLLRLAEAPLPVAQPGPWRPIPLDASQWRMPRPDLQPPAAAQFADHQGKPTLRLRRSASTGAPHVIAKEYQTKSNQIRLEFQFTGKEPSSLAARYDSGVGGPKSPGVQFFINDKGQTRANFLSVNANEGQLKDGAIVFKAASKRIDVPFAAANLLPAGQWNRLDMLRVDDRMALFINGGFVGALTDVRGEIDDKLAELTRTGLILQCAAGEVLIRGTEVREITALPPELLASAPFPPLDPAWLKGVAAMKPEQQVEAVKAELMKRNLRHDGKLTKIISGGVVTELAFLTDNITDIAPLQALPGLQKVNCGGAFPRKGKLADLSPLQDMKLTELRCDNTQVADLSPLQDMKLTSLNCNSTQVADLSPLKDMKLTSLNCRKTKVADLSPLKGMPLQELHCDFKAERDRETLRSIKTLKTINDKPAAEFWKEAGPK